MALTPVSLREPLLIRRDADGAGFHTALCAGNASGVDVSRSYVRRRCRNESQLERAAAAPCGDGPSSTEHSLQERRPLRWRKHLENRPAQSRDVLIVTIASQPPRSLDRNI